MVQLINVFIYISVTFIQLCYSVFLRYGNSLPGTVNRKTLLGFFSSDHYCPLAEDNKRSGGRWSPVVYMFAFLRCRCPTKVMMSSVLVQLIMIELK